MGNNSAIGFFDSGVGGLSVFSRFKKILPNENLIYFGDLKNLPYGNKTQEELISFARNILNFLDDVCMRISYHKYENPQDRLFACETALKLWETVIYDSNYLFYHCRIEKIYEIVALSNAELGNAEAAIDALEKALYHAGKFDSIPEGELKYTSLFVNFATEEAKTYSKNFVGTNTQYLKRFINHKKFNFLREDPRFEAIQKKIG